MSEHDQQATGAGADVTTTPAPETGRRRRFRRRRAEGPRGRDVRRPGRLGRIGLGPKLFLAFAVVSILAVVASGVAWISYGRVERGFEEVQEQGVRPLTAALRLARQAEVLAASAPAVASAGSADALDKERQAITSAIGGMRGDLAALQSAGLDAGLVGMVGEDVDALIARLDELLKAVEERYALTARREAAIRDLAGARDTYLAAISPGAQRISQDFRNKAEATAGMFEFGSLQEAVYDLTSRQLPALQLSIQLRGDIAAAQGIVAETATITNSAHLERLRQRLQAAAYALDRDTKALDDRVNKGPLLEAVARFSQAATAGDKNNVFEIRAAEVTALTQVDQRLQAAREAGQLLAEDVDGLVFQTSGAIAEVRSRTTEDLTRSRTVLIALAGASVAVSLLIALGYVGRRVIGRLRRLERAMRSVAAGDLTVDLPPAGGDEIGRMTEALQVFRDTTAEVEAAKARAAAEEERQREIRRSEMLNLAATFEAEVKGVVDQLAEAVSALGASSSELTAAAARGDERAQTVAAASEEAERNAETVSDATRQLSGAVAEIGNQVQEASTIARGAVAQVERTDTTVEELGKASEEISEVVRLIGEIAGQTNLLALNATIEAARAGEAGKGFAVVAGEVKTLAAETAKATGRISQRVEAIQNRTGEAVQAIRDVRDTILRLNEIASAIAAAVEQQGSSTQEIARSVAELSAGSREVSTSIADVADASSRTSEGADQVRHAADALGTASRNLDRSMSGFLDRLRSA
ncbi:methyl-accepting chemotaxis protein [Tistrella mobilis]|uniref:methyl-accepting chemotaxis protein n=1 Tax=Tistrella mobilis TaxID=171437 RepID=UPI0035591198